jgi:hypothetical protein
MRNFRIGIFCLLALTLFVASCKKDKTNAELLRSKNWKLVSLTIDPPITIPFPLPGVTYSDVFATLENCEKDDLTRFNEGGVVTFDEGTTKCNPAAPQTVNGVYSINSTETIVTVDNQDWNIAEISESKLKVTYKQAITGINYTYTATYE